MNQMRLNRRGTLLVIAASFVVTRPVWASTRPLSIAVYKDPSCGCCGAWAERLKSAGFQVDVIESRDRARVKATHAIPDDLVSCHTGIVKGFAMEGHVPPADILRFLKSKRNSLGLAVPGMPLGSPGMEMEDSRIEAYTVWEFFPGGSRTAFSQHK